MGSASRRTLAAWPSDPRASVARWRASQVRANQSKPVFFLLALSEDGRLEQMRVVCKRVEPGMRRNDVSDEIRVEHSKDWALQDSVPNERALSVSRHTAFTASDPHLAPLLAPRPFAPRPFAPHAAAPFAAQVSSQFVVTKHHAYCVVAVRGQVC